METNLNPQKFHVVLLDDFNVLGYDWVNGFPQANSHYYTKLRGDVIHSTTCYLGDFCTSLVGNICSALIIRPLANSIMYGDTHHQWLTPAQAGLRKQFTVRRGILSCL
jgi:hypothetical protein